MDASRQDTITRAWRLLPAAVAILPGLLGGCESAGEASHPQRDAIRQALTQSFTQSRDPFVVIEGDCDCFVQFMQDGGTLYYDFPLPDADSPALAAAREFHRQQGIDLIVIEDIDVQSGEVFRLETWQKGFSRAQVEEAVDASILALYRIYAQDKNSPFKLIRGWD